RAVATVNTNQHTADPVPRRAPRHRWRPPWPLLDDSEHVTGGEDQVLLAAVLHLGAAVLGVQHGVPDRDVERGPLAGVADPPRADSEDGALLRLLLRGVGNDDPRRRGGLRLVRLDPNPVLERLDRNLRRGSHGHTLLGYLEWHNVCR